MPPSSGVLSDIWVAVGTHLWQTSLVLVALLLVARWMRGAPAGLTNALLLVGLAKLLIPVPLLKGVAGRGVDAVVEAVSTSPVAARIATPLVEGTATILDPAGAASAGPRLAEGAQLVLTVAWFVGACALAAAWYRLSRSTGRPTVTPMDDSPERLRARLREALRGTAVPRSDVFVAEEPVVPHVAGVVRPRIIVPARLIEGVDTAELKGVLLHEDAHRRRREPLRLLLARGAAVAFFFYPLLWPLLKRLRETSEMACDDEALTGGAEPRSYARALAAVLEMGLTAAPGSAALDRNSPSLLRRRLERLNEPRRCKMQVRHRVLMLVTIVCVLMASALAMTSAAEDPTTDAAAPAPPAKPASPTPAERPAPEEAPAPLPEEFYIKEMTPPEYPEEARAAGVEAIVFLELYLDEARKVSDAKLKTIIVGHPPLEIIKIGENGKVVEPVEEEGMEAYHEVFTQAAVEAAMQWSIAVKPDDAVVENPAAVVPIQFRLNGAKGEEDAID